MTAIGCIRDIAKAFRDSEDVAASFVWATVHNHLPPLRIVIARELSRHEKG